MTIRDLDQQVERAAQRLGQLKARQLLREMRAAQRQRARARREDFRRRLALASAVVEAGCGGWQPARVKSILQDHFSNRYSTTLGESHE